MSFNDPKDVEATLQQPPKQPAATPGLQPGTGTDPTGIPGTPQAPRGVAVGVPTAPAATKAGVPGAAGVTIPNPPITPIPTPRAAGVHLQAPLPTVTPQIISQLTPAANIPVTQTAQQQPNVNTTLTAVSNMVPA